jgi:RluA family pseudouridine synthase
VSGAGHSQGSTRCIVARKHDGVRIDVLLAASTDLSRRAGRRLLADGCVRMNGKPIRVQSRTVRPGDVIDILRPAAELGIDPGSEIAAPTVLYRDRWILVADKPAGVLSAPAENMTPGETAFDEQVLVAKAAEEGTRPFLRLVHRLDRVTSGAILFACHRTALPALTAAWRNGRVGRTYVAVVEGCPDFESTVIDRPIGRDRTHAWRFAPDLSGREARTEARVISRSNDELAIVECRLITGRTHQVRVHLASIGLPVLGDRLYGSRRADEVARPLLHAASLDLPHPHHGGMLQIECPPPQDISVYLPRRDADSATTTAS